MKAKRGSANSPRVLIIDDDPVFRALIERTARRRGIRVTLCSSLREVRPRAVPRRFDAIVVDFYLDGMKAHLNGAQVALALEATPVLLISSSARSLETNDPWPQNVRKFLLKGVGPAAILDEAVGLAPRAAAFGSFQGGERWNP